MPRNRGKTRRIRKLRRSTKVLRQRQGPPETSTVLDVVAPIFKKMYSQKLEKPFTPRFFIS